MLAERIKHVCNVSYAQHNSVLPPTVCPYCMGCPVGTIVVTVASVAGHGGQQNAARPVPDDAAPDVIRWLDNLEITLQGGKAMSLTPEQDRLAKAIHLDFIKTYPGTPLQLVLDEADSQVRGNPPGNGILGVWIQDYFVRAGYIKADKAETQG